MVLHKAENGTIFEVKISSPLFFDSLALRAKLGLAFLKGSQPSLLCHSTDCTHSFGVAFGNLSSFGRLRFVLLNSV